MRRTITVVFLLLLLACPAWAGSFGEGQARFTAGDYKGAYESWLPLAEKGNARAQYSLGILFEKGLGVEMDLKQAEGWFSRAADQGYGPAVSALRAIKARQASPRQAGPAAVVKPKAPAATARAKPLSEREQIHALVAELVHQVNLQLRTGHLQYDDIRVSQSGTGFDVVIAGLVMRGGPGEQLQIGDVTGRFEPKGDRYYRINFALPSTLYAHEAGNGAPVEIRIGRQSNALLWDRDLELVVDMDVIWNEFVIVDSTGQAIGRIAKIAMVSDMTEQDGLWSGPVKLSMRDVELVQGQSGHLRLGEIGMGLDVDKLDMARYAALSRAVSQGEQKPDRTMQQLRRLLAGAKLKVYLRGLDIDGPDDRVFGLADGSYRLGIAGLDRKLASIEMAYAHSGLRGEPPDVPALTPRDASLRLTFDRLPVKTLLQTGITAALEYMFFGEVGEQGDVLNQLRLSLSEARTELRIADGRFAGPNLLMTVGGLLSADGQALWGLSGEVGVTVLGLDKLIAAVEAERPPVPRSPERPSFGDMMRSLGQLAADGKTYLYKFVLNRQGQFLVNGQDAAPLFAAFFGG